MMLRSIITERQRAMATVIWLWHMDRGTASNAFDVRDLANPENNTLEDWHMLALCRHAAVVLPEVPFVFPKEA